MRRLASAVVLSAAAVVGAGCESTSFEGGVQLYSGQSATVTFSGDLVDAEYYNEGPSEVTLLETRVSDGRQWPAMVLPVGVSIPRSYRGEHELLFWNESGNSALVRVSLEGFVGFAMTQGGESRRSR